MTPRPIYLLGSDGSTAGVDRFVPGRAAERVSDAAALTGKAPGLLLIPLDGVAGEQALTAIRVTADAPSDAAWLPLLLERGAEGQLRMLPVSVGWAPEAAEVTRWVEGAEDAQVLELRHVLTRVARGRHDLNNPLTSAMAETQMALMDAQDPALREGLETIAEQLRRIRDLVAALRALRAPS
jgi:signal transduction histidine kinase